MSPEDDDRPAMDRSGWNESVIPPLYVAYRQAPTPDASITDRSGPARREHSGSRGHPPLPGPNPGMAQHAPSQGQVVAGEGPVRSTGFSRLHELWAENTASGVLNLRFLAPGVAP